MRQIIERTLAAERLPIQVAQEATYMTTAIGMVHAGLGIAILPESALMPEPDSRLRAIAIKDPVLTRDIGHPHAGRPLAVTRRAAARGSARHNRRARALLATRRLDDVEPRLEGSGFAAGPLSVKSMITSSVAE